MIDWYQSARAALGLFSPPAIDAGYMHISRRRYDIGANFGDDCVCGFEIRFCHADIIRDFRDLCQALFAIFAIDNFAILAIICL